MTAFATAGACSGGQHADRGLARQAGQPLAGGRSPFGAVQFGLVCIPLFSLLAPVQLSSCSIEFFPLRACFKIQRGPVFAEKAAWRGATKEHSLEGSVTEEQRSQAAFSAKTRRAAGLLAAAGVGSALTARCGDARASPPWLRPKSLAAGPLSILKQAPSVMSQK